MHLDAFVTIHEIYFGTDSTSVSVELIRLSLFCWKFSEC